MGSPRVAPAQSFCGEPAATYRAVAIEGLERVVRTRRIVATRRRPAGKDTLVATHTATEKAREGSHQFAAAVGDSDAAGTMLDEPMSDEAISDDDVSDNAVSEVGEKSDDMVWRNVVCDQSSIGAVTRIR